MANKDRVRPGRMGNLFGRAWRKIAGWFDEPSVPPRAGRRGLGRLLQLEDRALLSASSIDPQIQEALAAAKAAQNAQAQPEAMMARREVAFVDSAVHEFQTLIQQLNRAENRQLDIVVLDGNRNGIEQITQTLAGYQNLDAVHFLSHGRDGAMKLGSIVLDGASVHAYASTIAGWSAALGEHADLLFYGCNLAEGSTGQALMTSLASLTGADVAASTDVTGHITKGGDWDLEFTVGLLETPVALDAQGQQTWDGVLAPPTANNDSYSVNEDNVLTVSAPGVLTNDTDPESDPLQAILVSGPSNGILTFQDDGSFTYTPNANFFGTDTFQYKANDGDLLFGDSNVATVTITVNPVNDLPVAVNDSYSTNEDVTLNVTLPGVLANDTDVDNTLTAILVSGPTNGSLTLNADGSFSYTPFANFFGSDSFNYKANDGTVDSNVATVTLTINSVNDPPVAVNESYSTNEDTPLVVAAPGVLANDSDPVEGSSLTAVLVSGPSGGSVTLNADGSFTYTPNANFNGTDSFVYHANDGTSNSNNATVTITVNSINDAPVNAMPGAQSVNEDSVLTLSGGTRITISDVDNGGGAATFQMTLTATNGTISLNGTTGLTFTTGDGTADVTMTFSGSRNDIHTALNGMTFTPTANFNGAATLTVTTSDLGNSGAGGTQTDTDVLAITVNPVNDAPVAVADSYSVNEDNTLNVAASGVLANDSDVDGNPLTAVLVTGPTNGSLTLNANGSFSYTPNANFNGTDSFVYHANDGTTNSNNVTVTLTVNAVNDAPVAVAENYSVNEDNTLNVAAPGVLANDTDVEGTALTAVLVSGTSNGALSLNANGSFSYTPNANFNGSDSFTYKANDGNLDSNVVTVNITVNAVNDAPVAGNDAYSTNEDTALVVAAPGVLGNDSDPVEGSPLTAVLVSGPSNGSLTLNADGSFTYTPNANFNGTDSFVYRANDGTTNSNNATVTLTVNAVNDAPVNSVPGAQSTNEDTQLTFSAGNGNLISISDVDAGGGQLQMTLSVSNGVLTLNSTTGLTFSSGDGTNDASMVFTGTVANINAALNGLRFTPNTNYNGPATLFVLTDDQGNTGGAALSDTDAVAITVNAVNDAPVAVNDAYSVNEDTTLNIAAAGVLTNDTDVENSPLTAVLVTGPTNGSLTLNADGSFSYTPNPNFNGSDSFTYRANDGTANSNIATVNLTINAVNDAPVATADNYSVNEDNTLNVAAPGVLSNDTDIEGNPLTAVFVSGTSNGTLTLNANGSFSYTPNANFNGSDSFTYKANDGTADSNVVTVTITVNAVNDAPVAVNDAYSMNEDGTLNVAAAGVLSNDTDIENNPLTATLVAAPSNGAVVLNADGSFTYIPNANFAGTDSFTYKANDGSLDSNVATVTITVNAINDAPVHAVPQTQVTTKNTALLFSTANANPITVSDDSGSNSIRMTLSVANGTLTLSQTTGLSFTTGDGTTDATMVFTGNVTNINAALEGMFYTPTTNYVGITNLQITTNDLGNSGAGGALSTTTNLGIEVVVEFIVNTTLSAAQTLPSVAINPLGNFVVAWTTDASGSLGVRAQRFDADGNPQGGQIQVNQITAGDQTRAAVAMDTNGGFVVVWSSQGTDGSGWGVYGQRFSATGAYIGAQFRVNTTTNGNQDYAAIAMDPNGNFVVVWQSDRGGTGKDIYYQRYAANGNALGGETRVNVDVTKDQDQAAIAMDQNGNFVVAWRSKNGDGSAAGVFARAFDAAGNPLTGDFQVNTTNSGAQEKSAIAMAPNGDFVIAWVSGNNQDGNAKGVFAQRFAADTTPLGAEFRVNTFTNNDQDWPAIAMDGAGNFTIVWQSTGQDGSGKGVYSQKYDALGNTIGLETRLSSTTDGDQHQLSAAMSTFGDLIVAWQGKGPGDETGIFGQHYRTDNDAPVNVVPGNQTTNEDTQLVFSTANGNAVSITDSDSGNFPMQVTLTVTNGTLTLNGVAGLTFTTGDGANDATMVFTGSRTDINTALDGLAFNPALNWNGFVTLTITSDDQGYTGQGGAKSDTDTVSIAVNPVNDAPVAVGEAYSVNEDNTLNVAASGVLANDSDVENSPLTAILVSGPANGSVTLNANGSFSYTPNANFNGPDSFTYKANDGTLDSNVVTVNLTVNAINDAPVDNLPIPQSTNEDTPLVFSAANGNAISISDVDMAGGQARVTLTITNGTLTLNGTTGLSFTTGDGVADVTMTFTGTVANINNALNGLTFNPTLNYNGSATLTITTNDQGNSGAGGALSDTDNLTITVVPVNDAPVAVGESYATNEDTPLNVAATGVLANDSDIDGDPLFAVLVSGPSNGTVILNADGSFSYTPNADFNGADSFTYKANDGNLDSNVVTVNLTVNAVNDAPVNGLPAPQSTNEDTPLVFSVVGGNAISISDIDMAGGQAQVTLTVTNGTLTLGGVAGLSFTTADGVADVTMTFTGTIADINAALDGATYSSNLNYNGAATLTLTTNDQGNTGLGGAQGDSDVLNITVNPVNDAPVAMPESYLTNEDTPLAVAAPGVLANDSDVEGTPLNAVLVTGPSNGTLILNADGSFVYTPNLNFNGVDSFTYKANDGTADSNVVTVTLTVNAVNDAPVAGNNAYSTNEDTALNIAAPGVLANDTDVEGSPLTANLVAGPANGTLTLNLDGSFTYTPNLNFNGVDSFTYRANDGTANSNVATVTITVISVNDAPVAAAESYVLNEDTPLVVGGAGVLANDSDVDADALSAVLVSGTSNGTLVLNANGSLVYTPNANFNGADSFTYLANDGIANSNIVTVNLTVNAVNDAPVAFAESYVTDEDTPLLVGSPGLLANDTDVENSPLASILVAGPSNGSLTLNADGSFSYASNPNFNGADSFSYKVNDGTADSNVVTITITINAINDAPVVGGNSFTVNEDAALNIFSAAGLLANASDVEATPLVAVLVSGPAGGMLSLAADGSFTYTPFANFNGSDSFTYKANDGAADSNIATVNLTITPVNDAPVRIAGSVNNLTVMQSSGLTSLGLEDLQYAPGGGADETSQTIAFLISAVPDSNVGDIVLADGVTVVKAGNSYTLSEVRGMQFRASPGGVGGPLNFSFVAQDSGGTTNGGDNSTGESLSILVQPIPPAPPSVTPPPPPASQPDPDTEDSTPPPGQDNAPIPEGETETVTDFHSVTVPQTVVIALESGGTPERRVLNDNGGGSMLAHAPPPPVGSTNSDPLAQFQVFEPARMENALATVAGATQIGLGITSTSPFMMAHPQFFWNQLSELAQQFEPESWDRLANVTFLTGLTVSAGYLLWNVRTWYLLASLLLSRPLWQEFDHMAVLDVWYNNPNTRRYLLGWEEDEDEEKTLGGVMS